MKTIWTLDGEPIDLKKASRAELVEMLERAFEEIKTYKSSIESWHQYAKTFRR